MSELSVKQKAFCHNYAKYGDGKRSYIEAGYNADEAGARVGATRLLKLQKVKDYLEELASEINRDDIADINEVKAFWTSIIRGEHKTQTRDRLACEIKASELLAKSGGAFIEKVESKNDNVIIINDLGDDDA